MWNPGDEFIRKGCLNLLREVLPSDTNYFFWDRNPDLLSMPKIVSNCYNSYNVEELKHINLVCILGSPDWYGSSYDNLFTFLLDNKIPLLAIGIGSPFENISLDKDALEIYNNSNTFSIARDVNVAKYIPAKVLPCPAIFCSDLHEIKTKDRLLITQTHSTKNQNTHPKIFNNLYNNWKNDVCVFYKQCYKDWISHKPYYSANPDDLIEYIQPYKHIVSTRLHGAIAALAQGCNAYIVTSKDNFRINSTAEEFKPLLSVYNNLESVEYTPSKYKEIKEFKEETRKQYISLLKDLI